MLTLLYPLLSGWAFFIGLGLTTLAILGQGWAARATVLAGLTLTLLSAVPQHWSLYASCALAVALWTGSSSRRGRVAARVLVLLTALALAGLELPWHLHHDIVVHGGEPVVVIGDSLSASLKPGDSSKWPARLATRGGLAVISEARFGARLLDGISQASAHGQGPCLLVIELGGNDLLAGSPSAQFAADLDRLLRSVGAGPCRIVMFELPLLPLQNAYGRIQRSIAQNHGVPLIPRSVLAGALARPGHSVDGLHLTAKGQAWLADTLARRIVLVP